MTDRVTSFVVTLEKDMRIDDAESTIAALRHIRGVISVEPHISDTADIVAEERARNDLGRKVLAAVQEIVYPNRGRGLGRPG